MQIIKRKSDNAVLYVFPDDAVISVKDDCIETPDTIICDLNSNNAEVISVTSVPADFVGNKYLYLEAESGGVFVRNPAYKPPRLDGIDSAYLTEMLRRISDLEQAVALLVGGGLI